MIESGNQLSQLSEPRESAKRLAAQVAFLRTGFLSTDAMRNNGADVVHVGKPTDPEGYWEIPLRGSITAVDSYDAYLMRTEPLDAHAHTVDDTDGTRTVVEVFYTGTDDQTRTAEADFSKMHFVPMTGK